MEKEKLLVTVLKKREQQWEQSNKSAPRQKAGKVVLGRCFDVLLKPTSLSTKLKQTTASRKR